MISTNQEKSFFCVLHRILDPTFASGRCCLQVSEVDMLCAFWKWPIVLLFLQKWSHVQCFQGRYETNTLKLWRFRYKRNNSDDVIMIPTSRTKLIDFGVIYISISRSWIFKLCPVMIQTVHGTEFTKALTLDWLIPFLFFLPARLLFYTWVFTDP